MKSIQRLATLSALCAGLSVPALHAQEINLFNGRDLTGWTVRTGKADFRVKDGCIVGANKDLLKTHTFLTTKAEYDNFILSFEFKADRDVNSGVQFRSQFHNVETRTVTSTGKTVIRPPDRVYGYQFEIDTRDARNNASIYDEGRRGVFLDDLGSNPAAQAAMISGDWNQCRIECRGDSIKTFLNGVPAASITDSMTSKGVIALQVHGSNKPGLEVRWRNIKLMPLRGAALTAGTSLRPAQPQLTTAVTAALTLDPNQPLLETFSPLAPNASAWVLAPLDEGVPPNVRQNLTYLREDLLDEYKEKPKASQEAYKLAHQLCSTMISALDERDQTLVRAGFRAVQADANASISGNQTLNARRNYMMSWPQYAREESQRAELRNAAASQSQVMKEQPKV